MKQLHSEEELKPVKKRKSRKTVGDDTQGVTAKAVEGTEGLDASILEAVALYQTEPREQEAPAADTGRDKRKGAISISKVKSKKMYVCVFVYTYTPSLVCHQQDMSLMFWLLYCSGSLTVTALDKFRSHSTAAFTIPTGAKAYLDQQEQSIPRIRYVCDLLGIWRCDDYRVGL